MDIEFEIAEDLEKLNEEPVISVPPEEPSTPWLLSDCKDTEGPPAGYSTLAPGLMTLRLSKEAYTAEEAEIEFSVLLQQRGLALYDGIWWTAAHWFIRARG